MRISDWSSDVCFSDLRKEAGRTNHFFLRVTGLRHAAGERNWLLLRLRGGQRISHHSRHSGAQEIGRYFSGPAASAVLRTGVRIAAQRRERSEEHTSELQSLMRISYAVFCLKKKTNNT